MVGVCQRTMSCMPGVAVFIRMLAALGLRYWDSVGRVMVHLTRSPSYLPQLLMSSVLHCPKREWVQSVMKSRTNSQ